MLKKISALVIFSAMLISMFSACAAKQTVMMSETYYSNGKLTLSANIYNYYLSYTKTMILAGYYVQEDYPELWAQPFPEEALSQFDVKFENFGDFAKYQALQTAKQFLSLKAYCQNNKLSLSKEMKNSIDSTIKEIIDSEFGGSKFEFNLFLSRFSLNESIYREIRELTSYYSLVEEHLFGSGGKHSISDADIVKYYNENYVRAEHILIKNFSDEVDDEGYEIPLTDEEYQAKQALANEIYNKILAGESSFETLQTEYNEDPGVDSFPDGYVFSIYDSYSQSFKDAAFDMNIGDYRLVESEYGWHIMKKSALLEDYSEHTDSIISNIQYDLFDAELKDYIDSIQLNEEEYDAVDAIAADVMFDHPSIVY